jgi:hypothetical protein
VPPLIVITVAIFIENRRADFAAQQSPLMRTARLPFAIVPTALPVARDYQIGLGGGSGGFGHVGIIRAKAAARCNASARRLGLAPQSARLRQCRACSLALHFGGAETGSAVDSDRFAQCLSGNAARSLQPRSALLSKSYRLQRGVAAGAARSYSLQVSLYLRQLPLLPR